MAIEHFGWRIQAASQPTTGSKDVVRKAQFGDGYAQVSGSGINDETLTYDFSFTGRPDTALEIHAFLRRHKTKAFSFTPPFGELALWRVEPDSLKKSARGKTLLTITATFEQAFAP
ncbi:phage tail protein [Superficieibacter electus]|uniref:Phage tail protein n=1 Tax=Superficieibacter electus TaxID=2022662 RepID=A0A2P5GI15_9ENTR|nr:MULTISPECIES: phage tail protein [Superficieibacter]POP41737.1 phage tail protein [Superficieibacter electus]POP42549.1 phage tail protein [Superficieibacter electus]WES69162.1 phage tail protein [Superficieibacter sp. HKU1]